MDSTSTETGTTLPQLQGLAIEDLGATSLVRPAETDPVSRPATPKHSSESTPDAFVQALRAEVNQQRPRSPYSRTHLRSYSAAPSLSAPPMARARSLPMYESRARGASPSHSPVRPSSPLRPPPAARSSPRRSFEDARPTTLAPSFMEDIAENSELDIQPRPAPTLDPSTHSFPSASHSVGRSNSGRRRPTSPLHSLSTIYAQPSPRSAMATIHTSASISRSPSSTPPPSNAARFNESYPSTTPQVVLPTSSSASSTLSTTSMNYSSASSVPTTPTSFRSRSPSISSLETIPDSPDAEEQAQATAAKEAVEIATLKAAAEEEESEEERRGGRRRLGIGDAGKRKRWSVCGGERRDAFEMETIWED